MSQQVFDVNDSVRASVSFIQGGVASDPAALTVKVKDPGGTITSSVYGVSADVVRVSTGRYRIDIDASLVGQWYVRFEAAGSAIEDGFYVRTSQF